MAKAEVGDKVRIKYFKHAGMVGTVKLLVRNRKTDSWGVSRIAITYVINIVGVGMRRLRSSHFDRI